MKALAIFFIIACSICIGYLVAAAFFGEIQSQIIWTLALVFNITGVGINTYDVYRM